MQDEIVIAEALDGAVRIHAARTTALVEEARKVHHCLATSAAALGRTLTVTAVMASDLKDPGEKVSCTFDGKGPCGMVNAQADSEGHVRGWIQNPSVYLTKPNGHLDVGKGIGTDGNLTVTRDLGLKEPFTGVVQIQTGEVGDDFAYYYAVSQQTPSVVAVGVLVNPDGEVIQAGGLILQLLPDAPEEVIETVEKITKQLRPMTELMAEGKTPEDVIHLYFDDADILETRPVEYACSCSKEHYHDAMKMLKKEDLQEMVDDGKPAEITCQYCGKKYVFSHEELAQILEEKCGSVR